MTELDSTGPDAHESGARLDVPAVRDLLERAQFDLERGWIEAAMDCIGRAIRLLGELERRL